jgi:hypothetical protein
VLEELRYSVNEKAEKLKSIYSKKLRARFKHTIGRPKGNIYYELRMLLGLTQAQAGELIGITQKAWQYRERGKVMYYPLEIAMLHELSGMSGDDFLKLLNDIA